MEKDDFLKETDALVQRLTSRIIRNYNLSREATISGQQKFGSQITRFNPSEDHRRHLLEIKFEGSRADMLGRLAYNLFGSCGAAISFKADCYGAVRNSQGEATDRQTKCFIPVSRDKDFLETLKNAVDWLDEHQEAMIKMFDLGTLAQNDINRGVKIEYPSESGARMIEAPCLTKFRFRLVPGATDEFEYRVMLRTNNPHLMEKLNHTIDVDVTELREWDNNGVKSKGGKSYVSSSLIGTNMIVSAIEELAQNRGLLSGTISR